MRVSEMVLSPPCCFAFVSSRLSFKESAYILSPWERDGYASAKKVSDFFSLGVFFFPS
jgi:hypothetical protein